MYQLTKAGLPNTCTQCAAPCAGEWYALSDDHAKSGKGYCKGCAFPESATPSPEPLPIEPEQPAYIGRKRKA